MQIVKLFFIIITAATLLGGNASAQNLTDLHKAAATDIIAKPRAQQLTAERVQQLIETGAKVNAKDEKGLTPLHYAVLSSNYKTMAVLLEFNAAVNAKDNKNNTPLHFAAAAFSPYDATEEGMLKLLIDNGANLKARNSDGNTPAESLTGFYRKTMKLLTPSK